jgi:hypothetical protein
MDLIPENLGGAVVFNLVNSCGANKSQCGNCADFAVAIHNWLMSTDIRYVLVDLQDEKEVCPVFLEELMQLSKRLRVPFLLAGVTEKPRRTLEAYDFTSRWPLFVTPEDAAAYLEKNIPGATKKSLDGLEFGVAIATSRPRGGALAADESVEADAVE